MPDSSPSADPQQPSAEDADAVPGKNSRRLKLPGRPRLFKWQLSADLHNMDKLEHDGLAQYRALDTLAATVFQTGLAVFIGGIAAGLTIHSILYRSIVIAASIPPFSCGCVAGYAMVDLVNEPLTVAKLAKKRNSVNTSALFLVISIAITLAAVASSLGFTGELN
jgi:hypothetical protein